MKPTDDDKFRDLLDFDLDDQRFICWDILPPAPPDRLAAIKDAIAAATWAGRIVVDELGRILYGHDDYRAFRLLGKPPRHILHVRVGDRFSRAEVEDLIRLWRYCDGGLATREERQAAIKHQLRITPHWSNREVARLIGVDKNTVQGQRGVLEGTGEIHQFLFPGGRGRTKGLPIVISHNRSEAKKNARLLTDATDIETKGHSARMLRQKVADRKRRAMERLGAEAACPENIRLFHCDFRELDAHLRGLGHRPGDVSLVWADPPWDALSLGVYPHLAEFAGLWLKAGGVLGVYPGTEFEDEANALLGQELVAFTKLRKLVVINNDAGHGRVIGGFKSCYQTILLFAKGEPTPRPVHYGDVIRTGREPKRHHDWQRTEAETTQWLTALTEPGELVVDPFGGGFTTAVCCLRLGLRCVSCDIEERSVNVGKYRVATAWEEMKAAKRK